MSIEQEESQHTQSPLVPTSTRQHIPADHSHDFAEPAFGRLADVIPLLIAVTDPRGHALYCNRRWKEQTHTDPGSLSAGSWTAIVHDVDAVRASANWSHSLRTGELFEQELRITSHDHDKRWHLVRALRDLNDDGTPSYWVITCTDIHRTVIGMRRDHLLAEAGILVAGADDYRERIPAILQLLCPEFCNFAAFHLKTYGSLPALIARTDERIECDMAAVERVLATGLATIVDGSGMKYASESAPTIATFIVLPVLANGVTVATLGVGIAAGRERDADDIAAIQQLADRLGATIHNANLLASAQHELAERKRAEEALRQSEELFRGTTEAMPHVVWIADARGQIEFINHRHRFISAIRDENETEQTPEIPEDGGSRDWMDYVHEEDASGLQNAWRSSLRTSVPLERAVRLRRGVDNSYIWHLVRAVPVHDHTGQIQRWIGTLTNIDEQRRAEEHSKWLSRISRQLMTKLDIDSIIRTVSDSLVPEFADWVGLDLVTDAGGTQRVLSKHADPVKTQLLRELAARYPLPRTSQYGSPRVIKTGKPQLFLPLSRGVMEAIAKDKEHRDLLHAINLRSVLCVPLIVRDRVIGALSTGITERRRLHDQQDLVMLEDLADRIALMLDTATLLGVSE